jgi:hypothetical protein
VHALRARDILIVTLCLLCITAMVLIAALVAARF